MQDWETLKVIISGHIRELDQVWAYITKLQKQEKKTTARTSKMETEVSNVKSELRHIADRMEKDAKTFKEEVEKRAGEISKQTFTKIAIALLGTGALGSKLDLQAIWNAISGSK